MFDNNYDFFHLMFLSELQHSNLKTERDKLDNVTRAYLRCGIYLCCRKLGCLQDVETTENYVHKLTN